jgi:ribosomal protein S18 acetylase RimI-like enzyme
MSNLETSLPEPLRGVTRRPETDADETFLREVYAGTREIEMALVPWDDAQKEAFLRQQFDAQRLHYRRFYPEADYDVILRDGRPIGRLYLDRGKDLWNMLEIALLPAYRSAGLGGALIRAVLDEAGTAGKTVHLHVEAFNPAQRLYHRLGFVPVEENGLHIHMVWSSGE